MTNCPPVVFSEAKGVIPANDFEPSCGSWHMTDDRLPGHKYARIEPEHRFLLKQLPKSVEPQDYHRFHDCHVMGARLSVRHVDHPMVNRCWSNRAGRNPIPPHRQPNSPTMNSYLEPIEYAAAPAVKPPAPG